MITPLLAYIFVKRIKRIQKGCGCCAFSSAITGRNRWFYVQGFDIRQQTAMIDREAAYVSYTTRIVFLTDSYIFCLNHPAILHHTVQVTHSLNCTHLWHACVKVKNTCVKQMHHSRALIHNKYLLGNDPPYNQYSYSALSFIIYACRTILWLWLWLNFGVGKTKSYKNQLLTTNIKLHMMKSICIPKKCPV